VSRCVAEIVLLRCALEKRWSYCWVVFCALMKASRWQVETSVDFCLVLFFWERLPVESFVNVYCCIWTVLHAITTLIMLLLFMATAGKTVQFAILREFDEGWPSHYFLQDKNKLICLICNKALWDLKKQKDIMILSMHPLKLKRTIEV